MTMLLTAIHGFAPPQQPAGYHTPITPGVFAKLFAVRHPNCGGKLLPFARHGSFLLKRCTDCQHVDKDVA